MKAKFRDVSYFDGGRIDGGCWRSSLVAVIDEMQMDIVLRRGEDACTVEHALELTQNQ